MAVPPEPIQSVYTFEEIREESDPILKEIAETKGTRPVMRQIHYRSMILFGISIYFINGMSEAEAIQNLVNNYAPPEQYHSEEAQPPTEETQP